MSDTIYPLTTAGRTVIPIAGSELFSVTPKGWQCPVCKAVWAPHWPGCSNCNRPAQEKSVYGATAMITRGKSDD